MSGEEYIRKVIADRMRLVVQRELDAIRRELGKTVVHLQFDLVKIHPIGEQYPEYRLGMLDLELGQWTGPTPDRPETP